MNDTKEHIHKWGNNELNTWIFASLGENENYLTSILPTDQQIA